MIDFPVDCHFDCQRRAWLGEGQDYTFLRMTRVVCRSDEVPAKLCNEIAKYYLFLVSLSRAHCDEPNTL